jgi:acyl-coenzyme A synthetase/AMP-(fatty) acid ligase
MDKYLNAKNPCVDGWYPTGDLCYRVKNEYFVVGRKDFQVKLRGQRIECGEIEKVLGHQAVVAKDPSRERLVAFVVGDRDSMLESESRQQSPIEVLLVQGSGEIVVLETVQNLLPFGFSK